MLPPGQRIRRREEFTAVVRRGRRAGRRCLVAHILRPPASPAGASAESPVTPTPAGPPRAGFIVSRTVGGAVVRNRVRRRLRHLVLQRLHTLPEGSLLVVRANPPAALATYDELAAELDGALAKLLKGDAGAPRQDSRRQAGARRPR